MFIWCMYHQGLDVLDNIAGIYCEKKDYKSIKFALTFEMSVY